MSSNLPDDLLDAGDGGPGGRRGDDGDDGEDVELAQFVFVSIGDREIAVPVEDVQTIVDPPSGLTRVPRTPDAIDGVVDLRGEITAVIEPREYFPAGDASSDDRKLLVFDRANDEQAAAVYIDKVLGVESVTVDDVVDVAELDEDSDADDVRAHPLLVGAVRQEVRPEVDLRDAIGATALETDREPGDGDGTGPNEESSPRGLESLLDRSSGPGDSIVGGDRYEGETFDVEEDDSVSDGTDEAATDESEEVVVETTPLLGVDELLRASGRAAPP